MDAKAHERYYDISKDYWWVEGTYKIVESYLNRFFTNNGNSIIMECACGPGNFLPRLKKYGKCFGSDLSIEALNHAQSRGCIVFGGDACQYPVKDESIDVLVMLDALEHIVEEEQAVSELNRILKSGGILVLSVPAFNMLWGPHDEMYGHVRRYRVSELNEKLKAAGFKVIKNSYIKPLFFLPVLIIRRIKERIKGFSEQDDFYRVPRWLNQILTSLFSFETFFLKRWNFPFGVSIVCVAQKKDRFVSK